MKIAHITATFPPYYSGTGMVCYHNALGLAALGHEVRVITADHPRGSYPYPPEITVERLPYLFRIGNAPLLPGLLALRDVDIIHLHHPFIFGSELVCAVAQARGIPLIVTHHNDLIGDGMRPFLFDSYSAVSLRVLFHTAQKLAAVSLDHAANCQIAPFFRRRCNDVVEIPNGVDTTVFHPGYDGAAIRHAHGIPADAPLVLFVGVLDRAHHFKGAGLLLAAFAALHHSSAHLMLVGDGDLKATFEAQAAELGLSERIHFVGKVSNTETPAYYTAADLVVLPTAPPESFGMVLIEAMACERPVITSNLPGVRSVVKDGSDGMLTEVGDVRGLTEALGILIDNPALRKEMGRRGRAKVEQKYAWPVIIPRLVAVYETMLAERRGAASAAKTT